MKYFIKALKNYANFSGRAQRIEYWMFMLVYTIFLVILTAIDLENETPTLALVFAFIMLIPNISVTARRLHDTGRTGWWQLIGIVPLIGFIVMIVFCVQDSHDENEYGSNPKLA